MHIQNHNLKGPSDKRPMDLLNKQPFADHVHYKDYIKQETVRGDAADSNHFLYGKSIVLSIHYNAEMNWEEYSSIIL